MRFSLKWAATALFSSLAFVMPASAAVYNLGGATGAGSLWSFDGPNLAAYRAAITDPANFGPAGTIAKTINTVDVASVSPASLAGLNGFIVPWTADSFYTASQQNDLKNFLLSGHDLFILQDDPAHDPIGALLGIPTVSNSTSTINNGTAPFYAGPFGNAANVNQGGAFGTLNAADVAAALGHVASTNASGQITGAYWGDGEYAPGAGRLVIITDVDMISTAYGLANYSPLNDNGRFALNITAFLVDSAPPPVGPGNVPLPAAIWLGVAVGPMVVAARKRKAVKA